MNTELRIQIINELEKFMVLQGMSANDVAKKTGVSSAYISNMRAGNFTINAGKGNIVDIADKYFEAIATLISFELEKSYWKNVPTAQMKRIISTLEDAKQFGYTNVIIGETGCGKTYIAGLFAQNFPLDCFTIKVSSQDNIGDLLEKVCDNLHIPTEKSKSKTLRAITRKLAQLKADGHKPMVIFDEAEFMRQPALCNMKELYDNLNGICSIILMGTDQLTNHLEKMRKKNKDGIPQLYRRIRFGIRVLPTIDRTFKQFLNSFEIPSQVSKFLRENCDNYGELHDVLVPALREAERTGQPITENFIRTILNMPII
jgi:DNA transposition AAA+ family ATPase